MKLNPLIPPGRSNRKARDCLAEIGRLHAEGYGCKAIHAALAEVGVLVSKSTVQREIARLPKPVPPALWQVAPASHHPSAPKATVPSPTFAARSSDTPTGKDIAEEFFKTVITNPLLRNKVARS